MTMEVVLDLQRISLQPKEGDLFVCYAVNIFGSVQSETTVRVSPRSKRLKRQVLGTIILLGIVTINKICVSKTSENNVNDTFQKNRER